MGLEEVAFLALFRLGIVRHRHRNRKSTLSHRPRLRSSSCAAMIGLMSSQGEELFSDDDGPAMEIHKSMTKTDLPNSDSDPEIFRKAKRKREASLPQKAEIEAKPDPFSRVGRPSAAPQTVQE